MAPDTSPHRSYPDLFIGGRWVPPNGTGRLESVDPSSEHVWASVPDASRDDVDDAVAAATAALDGPWARLHPSERGALLTRLAEALRADADRLAELESRDNGKPIRDTRTELARAVSWLTYYGGMADKIQGEQIPFQPGALAYTTREPVGVVAAITPWNSPLLMYSWKLGPALAAGNTVVLKPSDVTAVTALELAEAVRRVGFPDGVVNVVTGAGPDVGRHLVTHPAVNKISFTGSTATGQAIMRDASVNLMRLTLECGGKAAHIIFADADLGRALPVAVASAFRSTGQSCSQGSRLLVERSVLPTVLDELGRRAAAVVVGEPLDRATEIGPHASAAQLEKTMHYIDLGRRSATLVAGGTRPAAFPRGFYVDPTVFLVDDPGHRLMQEEIFGPVLTVMGFDTEDEAVRIANAVPYGLVSGLWTRSVSRAHRVAHAIRAGLVSVNTFRPVHYMLPYGGFKLSGQGRENGLAAIHEYTEVKTVVVDLSG